MFNKLGLAEVKAEGNAESTDVSPDLRKDKEIFQISFGTLNLVTSV